MGHGILTTYSDKADNGHENPLFLVNLGMVSIRSFGEVRNLYSRYPHLLNISNQIDPTTMFTRIAKPSTTHGQNPSS